MRTADFNFELPDELMVQRPLPDRSASRLLCLDGTTGNWQDRQFVELTVILNENDLLIFNDTPVIPARLLGHKESGGKIECLVERITSDRTVRAQIRASKPPKPGSRIVLEDGTSLLVTDRNNEFYNIEFPEDVIEILERIGHIPLPPYISCSVDVVDRERYQTIFADQEGAPTF